MTLGCIYNIFGNGCKHNILEAGCNYNNLCNESMYNTFDINCHHNTFGNSCDSNKLKESSSYNTFGEDCNNNTINSYSSYNSLGNGCKGNVISTDCDNNSLGNYCEYIIFNKSYFRNIIVDSGNCNINLSTSATTSSIKKYQNVRICLGVNNTDNYKNITDTNVKQDFETLYRPKNSKTNEI
jgi:hypothetical protein